VAALVATGAITPFDVVKKLTLKLGSNLLAVDGGFQVRSLESFRELGGLFVLGAAGEMGFWLPWRGTAYAVPQYRGSTRFFVVAPSERMNVIG
jgi:hypothetical protein